MSTSELIENVAAAQRNITQENLNPQNLNGTNLVEENPEGRQLNREKIDLVNPPEFIGIVLPVYLAIAAGALIIYRLLHKREPSLTSDFLSSLNRVPCMKCHFFTMNQYLKCAVNPSTVLTKQAIDCPDYRPRNGKYYH